MLWEELNCLAELITALKGTHDPDQMAANDAKGQGPSHRTLGQHSELAPITPGI